MQDWINRKAALCWQNLNLKHFEYNAWQKAGAVSIASAFRRIRFTASATELHHPRQVKPQEAYLFWKLLEDTAVQPDHVHFGSFLFR